MHLRQFSFVLQAHVVYEVVLRVVVTFPSEHLRRTLLAIVQHRFGIHRGVDIRQDSIRRAVVYVKSWQGMKISTTEIGISPKRVYFILVIDEFRLLDADSESDCETWRLWWA